MSTNIRPMLEKDVATARSIFSLAFGTFIGMPEPSAFAADCDFIGTRRNTDPLAAFVAEVDGQVVGSNLAVRWGSVGFFGPLTIRPDMWNRGLGRRLMAPIVECFDSWKLTHAGLHTFPHSTKHVHLYQQFGFWPRFLTAIMSQPVRHSGAVVEWSSFSEMPENEREAVLTECFELTNSIYPGLRLDRAIRSVSNQSLGDTVLIRDGGELTGMALCHCGPGTEAGEDKCYIKFGAARPGGNTENRFNRLLDACEALARVRGLSQLVAGVNLARQEACEIMLERGFRTIMNGLSMHRPNEPAYSRPGVFVIDDWR
jgi:N-acetylglutamate synthase-like GNAT family acetyltransferase